MSDPVPDLTVVAVFYDMAREAPRTLHTLRSDYQRGAGDFNVEVIAIDNGSPEPFDEESMAQSLPGVRLHRYETDSVSPVEALNWGIAQARAESIMCIIDGARMLSPGIFSQALDVLARYDNPLVATPALYLGSQLQTDAITNGYSAEIEDGLLASVDWQQDGYELFAISNRAGHLGTVFGPQTESNCFVLRTETLRAAGGFDERFQSIGGGLANLELFERLLNTPGVTPVSLLGEATFHQLHGGVTTNMTRRERPMELHHAEYESLIGHRYKPPRYEPFYVGYLNEQLRADLFDRNIPALISGIRRIRRSGDDETGLGIATFLDRQQPNDPRILEVLAESLTSVGDREAAIEVLHRATELAPGRARLFVALGRLLARQGDMDAAEVAYRDALGSNARSGGARFELGNLAKRNGAFGKAREHYLEATTHEPDDSRFRMALAQINSLLGDHEAAIEDARLAMELAPLNGRTRLTGAQILTAGNDHAGAAAAMTTLHRQITAGHDFDPEVYIDLVLAFEADNNNLAAVDVARHAFDRCPTDFGIEAIATRLL